ncbi:hypothetical protein N7462_005060 [Penicillium macrosclerotiorum]|uniref:uncharacterized protein n=1 Tax=Penicillium macrosclerotiorum TaxID=303699 RepID=UPI002547BEDA|nr:uncharacterized protein N7462_005060 [Penicillium macrosclerotiorum]KAJ5690668.1 hypothetical protein N7462_005060 [Penicillium macrosclerotiorum]
MSTPPPSQGSPFSDRMTPRKSYVGERSNVPDAELRDVMRRNDPNEKRTYPAVFYTSGHSSMRVRPPYWRVALESDYQAVRYLSDELLDELIEHWRGYMNGRDLPTSYREEQKNWLQWCRFEREKYMQNGVPYPEGYAVLGPVKEPMAPISESVASTLAPEGMGDENTFAAFSSPFRGISSLSTPDRGASTPVHGVSTPVRIFSSPVPKFELSPLPSSTAEAAEAALNEIFGTPTPSRHVSMPVHTTPLAPPPRPNPVKTPKSYNGLNVSAPMTFLMDVHSQMDQAAKRLTEIGLLGDSLKEAADHLLQLILPDSTVKSPSPVARRSRLSNPRTRSCFEDEDDGPGKLNIRRVRRRI